MGMEEDERMDPTPGPRELEGIARLIAEQIEARERMELRMRLDWYAAVSQAKADEQQKLEALRAQWADRTDR